MAHENVQFEMELITQDDDDDDDGQYVRETGMRIEKNLWWRKFRFNRH